MSRVFIPTFLGIFASSRDVAIEEADSNVNYGVVLDSYAAAATTPSPEKKTIHTLNITVAFEPLASK